MGSVVIVLFAGLLALARGRLLLLPLADHLARGVQFDGAPLPALADDLHLETDLVPLLLALGLDRLAVGDLLGDGDRLGQRDYLAGRLLALFVVVIVLLLPFRLALLVIV